jgi:hypothetical protein
LGTLFGIDEPLEPLIVCWALEKPVFGGDPALIAEPKIAKLTNKKRLILLADGTLTFGIHMDFLIPDDVATVNRAFEFHTLLMRLYGGYGRHAIDYRHHGVVFHQLLGFLGFTDRALGETGTASQADGMPAAGQHHRCLAGTVVGLQANWAVWRLA